MKKRWLGIPVWGWVATGVAVLGGVLYLRHKNSSAAAAQAAAAQAATAGSGVGVLPTTGYAATSAGQGYAGQNSAALSEILSAIQATQAPATTATTTPASTLNYTPLTSWQGAEDLNAAGVPLYYQPPGTAPGTYEPVTFTGPATAPLPLAGPGGAPLTPGMTLYQQTPS